MQLSLFPESHAADFDALARMGRAPVVAIDIETETRWPGIGPNLDYGLSYPADVTVIGFAWLENDRIATTAIAAPFEDQIPQILVDLFKSNTLLVAHNAVFDFRQLSKLTGGRVPRRVWDTLSMARLLSATVDARYSLVAVAQSLGCPIPESQLAMKGRRGKLHLIPLEKKVRYAQDDAALSLQIYLRQNRLPQDAELVDWECRSVREYCQMSADGIRLNLPYVETYLETLRKDRAGVIERLAEDGLQAPRNSKDRAAYLYGLKGIPLPTWPDGRRYFTWTARKRFEQNPDAPVTYKDLSTNARNIERILQEHTTFSDSLRDLAKFQELDWLISTLETLEKHAVVDGRLHSLVSTGTDTGRRASTNPQMQNWKMPALAGVAIGSEGTTLVEIDFRNAENIMAAFIGRDSNLSAACATPDFHSTMGAEYFGEAWAQAGPAERKKLREWSKRITYGTNYGMGAAALGRSLGVSEEEARAFMLAKDRAFANVTRTRARAQRQARQTQRLRLWTGRPIAVPSAFVAWNYVCQGGVSEVVKRAIVVVAERYRELGLRSRVALDMHDALIIETAHEEWDQALSIASQIMTSITPAEMNRKTDPPIRWVAEPNLKENAAKWGAQQWHPTLDSVDD